MGQNWEAGHPLTHAGGLLQMDLKNQEAQALQQQREQLLSQLQQYAAAWQQVASEKEALHRQFLVHTQLLDQLQHEQMQGKTAEDRARQELRETQVRPGAAEAGWEDLATLTSAHFLAVCRSAWRPPPSRTSSCRPSSAFWPHLGKVSEVTGGLVAKREWRGGDSGGPGDVMG